MVLFVIAAMAGVAVLQLGDRDRSGVLDREAQRLRQLLELAREEAILEGAEWGLVVDGRSYAFVRLDLDARRWIPVEERPFAEHDLPDPLALRLRVESRDAVGAGADAGALLGAGKGPRPALLMLSSGEMTPFELRLGSLDDDLRPRRLASDGFSKVSVDAADGAGARPGRGPR